MTLPEFEALLQPLLERRLFTRKQIEALWEKYRGDPPAFLKRIVNESARLRDLARDLDAIAKEIHLRDQAEARRLEDVELTPAQRAARDREMEQALEAVKKLPPKEAV